MFQSFIRTPGEPQENATILFKCTFDKKSEQNEEASEENEEEIVEERLILGQSRYDFVDSCNMTLSGVNRYHLRSWGLGNGENAFWLGGPTRDGQGTKEGNFKYHA